MPYFLRQYLGRLGALVAALLLAVSPSFLYWSRFERHDIYLIVWTFALVILVLKYFEDRRTLYLYLLAAVLSLSFAKKGDIYITLAVFGTFLLATNGLDFLNILRSKATFSPQSEVTILFGTFLLPLAAGNNRVEKFDALGSFVLAWGQKGQDDGQFNEPWGIGVDGQGNVFVADTWNHRIEKIDDNGAFLAKWGQYGTAADAQTAPGSFFGPRGIVVDPQRFVYVTDTGNHRIQKFDADGKFVAAAGGRGGGPGQFNEPVGIGLDSAGSVIVADTWNRRIQKLDANLKPLAQWPVAGWASNSVVDKPYLAIDAQGDVFTTDPEAHRILQFSNDGTILGAWGKYGTDLASLQMPTGLAIDFAGRLLVADSLNHRVVRFAPGK